MLLMAIGFRSRVSEGIIAKTSFTYSLSCLSFIIIYFYIECQLTTGLSLPLRVVDNYRFAVFLNNQFPEPFLGNRTVIMTGIRAENKKSD